MQQRKDCFEALSLQVHSKTNRLLISQHSSRKHCLSAVISDVGGSLKASAQRVPAHNCQGAVQGADSVAVLGDADIPLTY